MHSAGLNSLREHGFGRKNLAVLDFYPILWRPGAPSGFDLPAFLRGIGSVMLPTYLPEFGRQLLQICVRKEA